VTCTIEVEDTGIGIAPENLDRLFVEFEQLAHHTNGRPVGTGLGLALTRRIVEAQGGQVGVHSVLGRGSLFWALLPVPNESERAVRPSSYFEELRPTTRIINTRKSRDS
jgi:signal transduction histidine kinase